ncbi:MAG TPA: DivIVA domain-containing protein [Anaeromyxobacteraceae bacterium]|jgi:cell division initiation protein
MKITPLDITQKAFRRRMRGLDREEVEGFLALVAGQVEELARENQLLREDVQHMDEEISELRSRERALQETMITAQRACEEMREAARKEAEITLAEAELQAEKIVQGAHVRYTRIVDDINEMKRQRVQFEAEVRAMVEGHLKLLAAFAHDGREAGVEYLPSKKKSEA